MDKEVIWLHGEIKTPPFSEAARIETGVYLRQLQQAVSLAMPYSRPMASIGPRCHELRVPDEANTWRVIYRIDSSAIVIAEVFAKKTQATPQNVIKNCKRRFAQYDAD